MRDARLVERRAFRRESVAGVERHRVHLRVEDDARFAARTRLPVPIYTGLPFGHVRDKLTLPIGGRCDLAVSAGHARLRFSGYP